MTPVPVALAVEFDVSTGSLTCALHRVDEAGIPGELIGKWSADDVALAMSHSFGVGASVPHDGYQADEDNTRRILSAVAELLEHAERGEQLRAHAALHTSLKRIQQRNGHLCCVATDVILLLAREILRQSTPDRAWPTLVMDRMPAGGPARLDDV